MTCLSAIDAGVTYSARGRTVEALRAITLDVPVGEIVVALGASGCGKSTLLGLFAGFVRASSGTVQGDGAPITGPGPDRAVVFQDDALMPWLSVRDNVAFGLKLRGVPRAERDAVAGQWLDRVGLSGFGGHAIAELSGGMRQRVGLARALAVRPRYLLLDEPLGALDELTRERMQVLLLQLWRDAMAQAPIGLFLITHSIEEALLLATELVLLSPRPGRVVHRIRPTFAQRFLAGESIRAIKADPAFLALREELALAILTSEEEAESHA